MTTSGNIPPDDNGPDSVDADPGDPIEVLARFGEPVAPDFGERLRGRIHRGVLGKQVLDLVWAAPAEAAVEWLTVLLGLFKLAQPHKGVGDDE